MNRHPIEIQIENADRAIVAEDFDTLLGNYIVVKIATYKATLTSYLLLVHLCIGYFIYSDITCGEK